MLRTASNTEKAMYPRGDAIFFRFNPELGFAVVMQPPCSGNCSPFSLISAKASRN